MADYTPTTEEVREDFAFPWSPEQIGDRPARVAAFNRWLDGLIAKERADERASVLAEQGEPEYEYRLIEPSTGNRFGPYALDDALKERDPGDILYRRRKAGPWLPVEENEPESTDGSER